MNKKSIRELLGEPNKKSLSLKSKHTAKIWFAWFGWFLSIAANGILLALWIIFGLAAAGNSNEQNLQIFFWMTAIGAGMPLVVSLYFAATKSFLGAFFTPFFIMPLIFAIGLSYAAVAD